MAMTMTKLHHKLGHASPQKILHMISNGQLKGVTLLGPKIVDHCYGCTMGKQHRHNLTLDEDKPATQKLDLIHMDVMGPFKRTTRQGHKYVLTIIDDCSRYARLFLLEGKQSVLDIDFILTDCVLYGYTIYSR
jgi:hypothetical protein